MYGIFTYIYDKNQPNVGKYTSCMDSMESLFSSCHPCHLHVKPRKNLNKLKAASNHLDDFNSHWGQDLLKMNFVNKEQFEQVIKCPACFFFVISICGQGEFYRERSEPRVF